MPDFKVTIIDDRFDSYDEENRVLNELNCKLKVCSSNEESEIIKATSDSDAVIVNLAPITKKVIEFMKKCRVISRYGVGYDNIDIDSATKAGIWVAIVPDYSIEDVSDHAVALLLDCIRKISYKDRMIRKGKWNLHKVQPVRRIKGKKMGIVGYGRIGRTFHKKLKGFGFEEFLVYDPYVPEEYIKNEGARKVDFFSLLRQSDYISIHVPLSDETKRMFDEDAFNIMKKNVIIINTSRGSIIDEDALIEALKGGKIECAGLDVFAKEPLPRNHPFKSLDNVVMTDHAAYYSVESIVELKEKAAKNVLEVLKGNRPVYYVNEISR